MNGLVEKGYFLDLSQIEERFRPEKEYKFFYVLQQNLTSLEDLTLSVSSGGTDVFNFGTGDLANKLKPEENMIFQIAYGIYPNVKTYLEYPVDYDADKIPQETSYENWRVGIIMQSDSSYHDPSFEKTEFWIFPQMYQPRIHVFNPYDLAITTYLRLLINLLVVESVTDRDVINQLEKRIKPSTPVMLRPF